MRLEQVAVRYPDGKSVTMLAEQSVTPGLLVVPTLTFRDGPDAPKFAGTWGVTHRSGMGVAPVAFASIDDARDLAMRLGWTFVDWTGSEDEIKQCSQEQTAAVKAAIEKQTALAMGEEQEDELA